MTQIQYVEIEDHVHISTRCSLLCHQGNLGEYYAGDDYARLPYQKKKIVLMKGCLLGIGTIVLGGVTVGEGAIIGAGSLVVKDIPAWTIAYGSPARLADNIISYIENHTMADIHGASGYRFARDYYGREEIAGYFLKLLEGIKNG